MTYINLIATVTAEFAKAYRDCGKSIFLHNLCGNNAEQPCGGDMWKDVEHYLARAEREIEKNNFGRAREDLGISDSCLQAAVRRGDAPSQKDRHDLQARQAEVRMFLSAAEAAIRKIRPNREKTGLMVALALPDGIDFLGR